MADPYVHPGSTVLRNLSGLQDADALAEHEAQTTTLRLAQLAAEQHLRGLSREQFAERLTHYHAEINAVHPFREGNGRARRAFLRQLALDAGHTLALEHLDARVLAHASQRSFMGDNHPTQALIEEVLDLPGR